MQSLTDKKCLVTGGTRGIGLAITRMLLSEGARVAICGRNSAALDSTMAELRRLHPGKVAGKVADVKAYEQVRGLFAFVDDALGGIDVLVNNAGAGAFAKASDLSLDDWSNIIGTNLNGPFYCTREALPRMVARGGGHIVNISSLAGRNAFAGGSAYNASKFGLNGFSEALMLDARYDGIRVSTVAPGSVATDFGGHAGAPRPDWKVQPPKPEEGWKVQPDDIADIVGMLLRIPSRTMVSYLEVRPSQPPRKG